MSTLSGVARVIGRSVAWFGCLAVLAALALFVLFCSLLGLAFVIITAVGLTMALTGHIPERMESGAYALTFFAIGFPLSVLFFGLLSLPGFAWAAELLRSLWALAQPGPNLREEVHVRLHHSWPGVRAGDEVRARPAKTITERRIVDE
jgi:hypothetical protein